MTMNVKKSFMIISIILVMILWVACPGKASEFHVTTAQELQTALSTASKNGIDDTIFLAEGRYNGNFNFITSEDQTLTIIAEEGLNPGQVILNGQNLSRVLLLQAETNNVNFILENITIQNGKIGTANGAGVFIKTIGNVNITRCYFTNNHTGNDGKGGGLYVISANIVTLENNNITHNSANWGNGVYICQSHTTTFNNNNIMNNIDGGPGLYLDEIEAVDISHNNIINNSSKGGVWLEYCGNIEFINNDISSNITYDHGGGIRVYSIKPPRILNFINNRINNNSAKYGGAVSMGNLENSTITFTNNTISGNSASYYGGLNFEGSRNDIKLDFTNNSVINNSSENSYGGFSFYTSDSGSITFKDNIISGNTAKNGDYGGGFINATSSIEFINNVITNNISSVNRGGLYIYSPGFFNIINNTISGNKATGYAGGVQIDTSSSTDLNFYNNIVWGNQAGGLGDDIYLTGIGTKKAYNNTYHDLEGLWSFAGNNVDIDPFFINPEKGDFHLQGDSQCLNIGDANAPNLPETDIEGNPRIADGAVDLGAYEHSTSEFHPADANGDWTITPDEFTAYGLAWKNGDLWQQAPGIIPIDYATRAGFLLESGGAYQNVGGGKPGCWVPQP